MVPKKNELDPVRTPMLSEGFGPEHPERRETPEDAAFLDSFHHAVNDLEESLPKLSIPSSQRIYVAAAEETPEEKAYLDRLQHEMNDLEDAMPKLHLLGVSDTMPSMSEEERSALKRRIQAEEDGNA